MAKKTKKTLAGDTSKKESSVVLLGKSHVQSQQVDDEKEEGILKDIGVLHPTFPFDSLINLYSENATLQRCIDVTAGSVTKNGYGVVPDNTAQAVPSDVTEFFENGNPDSPFAVEMEDLVTDLLNTGSAAMEITRFAGSVDGKPSGFYRAPIGKMRVARGRSDDKKYGAFRTGQRFVEIDETLNMKDEIVWYNKYTPERDMRVESEGFARKPPKGSRQKKMTEIMWFKLSNPDSKYYGQSPAISLSRVLLMAKYTEEFNIDQFEHGWLQKFLFVVKRGSISDEQLMELEEYIEEVIHEEKRWNKVPIINLQGEDNADFEVKFLNQHQPEGAYLNLMKYLREMVFMAYGVPPILLNLVENANRCLTAETVVSMVEGRKPISEIEVGDMVYSFDDGKLEERKVINIFENGEKEIYKITCGGKEINCTANHPFALVDEMYDEDFVWCNADQLMEGDSIIVFDNTDKKFFRKLRTQTVDSIEKTGRKEMTYDIEVEDSHNFIANGILVHNSNSRDQRETFYHDQVRPLQMLIAYKFTKMIRQDFGFSGRFVFYPPDLTDMKEDSEIVKDMVRVGEITINEGREMLNMPRVSNVPYADVHLIYLPNSVHPINGLGEEDIIVSAPTSDDAGVAEDGQQDEGGEEIGSGEEEDNTDN